MCVDRTSAILLLRDPPPPGLGVVYSCFRFGLGVVQHCSKYPFSLGAGKREAFQARGSRFAATATLSFRKEELSGPDCLFVAQIFMVLGKTHPVFGGNLLNLRERSTYPAVARS